MQKNWWKIFCVEMRDIAAVSYLHCVFECQQDIESLILGQVLHVDTVVDVTQLLGSDRVWCVHLSRLPIMPLPLLWGSSLQKISRNKVIKFTQWTLVFNIFKTKGFPTENKKKIHIPREITCIFLPFSTANFSHIYTCSTFIRWMKLFGGGFSVWRIWPC